MAAAQIQRVPAAAQLQHWAGVMGLELVHAPDEVIVVVLQGKAVQGLILGGLRPHDLRNRLLDTHRRRHVVLFSRVIALK